MNYLLHSKMYLLSSYDLKYVIKHEVYSILNSKSTAFNCCHLGGMFFFSSSSIHQLSPHRVNNGSHLMVKPCILLPLPVRSWFLHFLYHVALVWVNILSHSHTVTGACTFGMGGLRLNMLKQGTEWRLSMY